MKFRCIIQICSLVLLLTAAAVADTSETPEPYQKEKQTVLKKYVTAQEAYWRWRQSPDTIHIIDCRTPEEYLYVGHAPMAVNIPSMLGTWDAAKSEVVLHENPRFEALVQKRFSKTDILMVMCRSGSRSSESVNRLARVGFQNVYTIIDGFEGDKVKDKHSYYEGKRLRNGWKNASAPWTYDVAPDRIYSLPDQPK